MKGLENIQAFDGVATAISGMCIVFSSLLLLSLYIAVLPRILEVVHRFLPEADHPDELAKAPVSLKKKAVGSEPLEEAVAVAVAFHNAQGGR